MEVNREEVRSGQGIEFTENRRPVQLREGIVDARNGQVNGRIDGEPDVKAFGKSAEEMLAVQFRRVRSDCDEKRGFKAIPSVCGCAESQAENRCRPLDQGHRLGTSRAGCKGERQ